MNITTAPILPVNRRPRCRFCNKRLQPAEKYENERVDTTDGFYYRYVKTGLAEGYGYAALNLFCTLRCGFRWAVYEITSRTD